MDENDNPITDSKLFRRGFLKQTTFAGLGLSGAASGSALGFSQGARAQEASVPLSAIEGNPSYTVGEELGFFVWGDGETVTVDWNSDKGVTGNTYVVAFEVSTDGTLEYTTRSWNPVDTVQESSESRVSGVAGLGGVGYDGLQFSLTDATTLTVDLKLSEPIPSADYDGTLEFVESVDKTRMPDQVFLGEDRTTAPSLPLTIDLDGTTETDVCSVDSLFCDAFSDGDYAPEWTIYLDEGDYSASVTTNSTAPLGGENVLETSETTGGGTNGVIGWSESQPGWDQPWTMRGSFYTENIGSNARYTDHRLLLYYDGSTKSAPVMARLGFTGGDGQAVPFRFDGDLVSDTDRTTYLPPNGWAEDTWYNYEIGYDGRGGLTGRLWLATDERPEEPNIEAAIEPFGKAQRVAAIRTNGPGDFRLDGDFTTQYGFLRWTEAESQEPSVAIESVDLPPTAFELDEIPVLEVVVDRDGVPVDDIAVETDLTLYSGEQRLVGPVTLDADVDVDGQQATFSVTFPDFEGYDSLKGTKQEFEAVVTVDGEQVGDVISGSTFAFDYVQSVYGVAAKPNDVTPSEGLTGENLRTELREQAEYVNEYYASGLGSMGAHGFDFTWLNRTDPSLADDDGYLELDNGYSTYDDNRAVGDNSVQFVQEALDAAATDAGVDFSEYATAIVTNGPYESRDYVFSRSFWRGELVPELTVPVINKSVEIDVPGGIAAFDTPGGSVAGIYAPLQVDTWVHEFGHSLGPGNQVGFPDLYEIDAPFQSFGEVKNWGLMGGRDGKVINTFCRNLGSDPFDSGDGWLEANRNTHILSDIEVSLRNILNLIVGDEAEYVVSAWADISVEAGDGFFDPVDVNPDWSLGIYLLEARPGGEAYFQPPWDYDVPLSPASGGTDGVALFEFGVLDLDVDTDGLETILEDILDGNTPDIEVDAEAIDIEYVPPESGDDDPTMRNEEGESFYLEEAATTFEVTSNDDNGNADVELVRDTGVLGDTISFVTDILGDLEDSIDNLSSAGPEGGLPTLDVYAEAPDGRRVGFDPESGARVNEIDGARISGTVSRRRVTVPADEEVEFTVSDRRLREALEDRGYEPPETFEYERELVSSEDVTIEERDGFPFFDGRIRLTEQTNTAADASDVTSVTLDLEPPRLNAKSGGNFVTAYIGFDADRNLSEFSPEEVLLSGVQAVSDEQYGFVKNPPIERRDGEQFVMVKFPRQELIERLGIGEAHPQLLGRVGETLFRGRTSVTVTDPGPGGRNHNGNGNGNGNRGNNGNRGR